MIARLYRALTVLGWPLIRLYLARRLAAGKEDRTRFGERLGHPGLPRPAGPLVWLHGASVGEAMSLLPLVEALARRPGLSLLVTTGTVTSARLLAERLPAGVVHQYLPVDRPAGARRFLDHWRPDLALWAESDFWPNLLAQARRRKIPLVLVQGRISERSFRGWRRLPGFIREVLAGFALCLAQTPEDARRLESLGAARVLCLGNLKQSGAPLPCDAADLSSLSARVAGRPVWLAASTHEGEEALAGAVHQRLTDRFPTLLTLVAPRHPARGPAVGSALEGMGLRVALRSRAEAPGPETDIYVVDTLGELGLFYRLAPVVAMGKSFVAEGGQNPFEPASLGAAVLFGPRMSNFAAMAAAMRAAGAAREVADARDLAEALAELFADPDRLARARRAALAWAGAGGDVLDAVLGALAPFLATVEARHARS
jgi:3-deoxy-D-manno-octulosonic-acid transferase